MNKRQKNKKRKVQYATFAFKLDIAHEMKEDSIAHKIKSYFELNTIQNKLLFNYDRKNKKFLISKKHVMYLLSLCNDVETMKDYDMEIVECNDIFKEG